MSSLKAIERLRLRLEKATKVKWRYDSATKLLKPVRSRRYRPIDCTQ